MMRVAIIDSGCANVASVAIAVRRAGGDPFSSTDPVRIGKADRVILPGVGTARAAMERLRQTGLDEEIPRFKQPVLGICLGMQILHEASAEDEIRCLAVLPGRLEAIPASKAVRVPHMGWNQLAVTEPEDPLVAGIDSGDYAYFVHGYYLAPGAGTLAESDHGISIAAIVRQDNFWGCQFHPERSATLGARILKNFLELPC